MKTLRRIILAAMAMLLVAGALGCSCSVSTAKINNAIMTDSVDADGKPGITVTSYPADTAVLYTSAILNHAPDNTNVRIVWIYATTGETINEVSVDSGDISDRYIYATITSGTLLPEGDYEVRYYVDGRREPDAVVKFLVTPAEQAAVAQNTQGMQDLQDSQDAQETYLEDVHLTSGIDANGVPLDTITSVKPTGTWYVSAILRNAQPDTYIRFVWYDTQENVIDDYDFDPQGETDIYIFGTLNITTVAPEGQYWVELYIGDGEVPAAQIGFTVSDVDASSAADLGDFKLFTMEEAGFSLKYPKDWKTLEMKEDHSAAFYSEEYQIQGNSDLNVVVVVALKDYATGYTLDEFQQGWIKSTENKDYENYQKLSDEIDAVNGRDMATYVYSWTSSGYDLYTMDFITVEGADVYVITFTATADDIDALYPYLEAMVLSFDVI